MNDKRMELTRILQALSEATGDEVTPLARRADTLLSEGIRPLSPTEIKEQNLPNLLDNPTQ